MAEVHERCLTKLNADGTCPACDDCTEDDIRDEYLSVLAELS